MVGPKFYVINRMFRRSRVPSGSTLLLQYYPHPRMIEVVRICQTIVPYLRYQGLLSPVVARAVIALTGEFLPISYKGR
jgi:hypothetical protein